jgi:hypothetical protein
MSTIDGLRQRLEMDFLEPVTEQTAAVPLSAGVDNATGSWTVDVTQASPDELALIGPGITLEAEYELVRCTDWNSATGALTVTRNVMGSTAATHASGVMVRLPTRFTRMSQERELRNSIDSLFPPLRVAKETRATTDSAGWVPLPLNTVGITEVEWYDGRKWYPVQAKLFSTHPLDDQQAGLQLEGVTSHSMCVIRYSVAVSSPTLVTDTITDLPDKWERLIVVDAAIALMSGVDVDSVTQEYLTEQMRLERFPVRSGESIMNSLVRYREYLLQRFTGEQKALSPAPVRRLPTVAI